MLRARSITAQPFAFSARAWIFRVFLLVLPGVFLTVARAVPIAEQLAAAESRHETAYRAADYPTAVAAALEGLGIAAQSASLRDQVPFLRHLAYDYWLIGDSELALDYSQRVLTAAEKLHDNTLRAVGHRYLGLAYFSMGNFAQSRPQTEEALRFAKASGDADVIASIKLHLGNELAKARDVAGARQLFEEVLAHWEKKGNPRNASNAQANLADLAEQQGDLPAAIALYEKIYAVRVEANDRRGQVRALCALAGLLVKTGRAEEASAKLATARPLVESIGGFRLLHEFHSSVAQVQEARGDYQAALVAERLAVAALQQVIGERARLHAADLAERLELSRHERTIAALTQEKDLQAAQLHAREAELARARDRALWITVASALGFAALIAVVVSHRLRLRTERRALAESEAARALAEDADQSKTRFLSIASRDLRGPLGHVVDLMTQIRSETLPLAPNDERLDLVAIEAQRVTGLVQDLVELSAVEAGALVLDREPTDLTAIVRSAVRTHERHAQLKRVTLTVETQIGDSPFLSADAERLHQVAANLIGNALRFTPPGRTVTITLTRTAEEVTFSVRDEGPGLSPEDVTRLSQPFTTLAAHPTAGTSSHGLGLSLAHEIVRLHGGALRVFSEPGAGATFTVTIPVASAVS